MYCTIIEKKSKKQPYGSQVYRKLEWVPIGDDSLSGYWNGTDEVQREPRDKWDIVINLSFRENSKVMKKQRHIRTITYWDVIDCWYSEILYDAINKFFPKEYEKVERLIYAKFQPIIDRVLLEYQTSEEYAVKMENNRLRKEKEDEIKNKKRQQDEEYEQQRQKYYSDFKGFNFGTSGLSLNDSEKELAKQLIVSGYKVLAKKYHPDVGGSAEEFQILGNLKDKLINLI